MELIVGGLAAIAVVIGAVVLLKRSAEQRRLSDEAELIRAQQLEREDSEARAATPLVADLDGSAINAIGRTINELLAEFNTLTSFQDVASWDARAEATSADAEVAGRTIADFVTETERKIAEYRVGHTEPHHVAIARIEKTKAITKKLGAAVAEFANACDLLLERVEMTPNNKKDQSAVLRELRLEKKEFQAQKKEVKAGAAEVRRNARVQSAQAGSSEFFGWPTYNSRVAAIERRAIRKEKEAALGPHEDAVDAIERQIASVERRIAWVQRFGDEPEDS